MYKLLLKEHIVCVAVQETKISSDKDTARALDPFVSHYEVCVRHADGLSGGRFLFFKKNVGYSSLSNAVDDNERLICCDFILYSTHWQSICIYAYNDVRQRCYFYENLIPFLPT